MAKAVKYVCICVGEIICYSIPLLGVLVVGVGVLVVGDGVLVVGDGVLVVGDGVLVI